MLFNNLETILPYLKCPITGERLIIGNLTNDISKTIQHNNSIYPTTAESLLINTSRTTCFPVFDNIADLRPSSGIQLQTRSDENYFHATIAGGDIGESVRNWYNTFGWQKTQSGYHQDTAYYSMPRSTPYGFYESLSHFEQKINFKGGKFLLDAASGPIAHPEYFAYSESHQFRVCIDFSDTALKEASRKLGDHTICIQADVLNLPFEDNLFDGVISGYTVQHIDQSLQEQAVRELYRVLRPGNNLCIMATQSPGKWHNKLKGLLARLASAKMKSTSSDLTNTTDHTITPPSKLYGHIFNTDWWQKIASELTDRPRIEVLRFFSKDEFHEFSFTRESILKLRAIETLFSRRLARYATLVSIIIPKQ
jgi:ubiquinone/menaquinone biosynthesis C-methylase UbiE